MSLSFKPLHPDVGVQVSGCDLSRVLSDQEFSALVEAYYRYSVVVVRGQSLSPVQQAAFLRGFGTPKISQRKEFHVPGAPEIGRVGNVKNQDGTPAAFLDRYGDLWHSDTASDDHLDGITALYCVKTPEVGGDTCFVSLGKAYETLSADLKARIEGRRVTHNFNKHNDYLLARNQGAAKPLSPEDRAKWEDRVHDLVQTHPVTGRRLYFISPTLVKTISGYTEEESQELAQLLVEHATRPECVYRHKWLPGDLVFWDNHGSLHSASPANYAGGDRLMHRGYAYVDTGR